MLTGKSFFILYKQRLPLSSRDQSYSRSLFVTCSGSEQFGYNLNQLNQEDIIQNRYLLTVCGKKKIKLLKINLWRFGPFQLPSYVASPEQIKDLKLITGFIICKFIVN